ncbi:uncharacterized protein PV09_01759 [Verruconis gallopava]|uniref:Uncharacterized protein n=1 Tax=Verruconis gallopava TaxID=253628 RepID=A0A0D1XYF7_9PEZI|nr:uncharacterized protein PV09_01759 [Verruconis gallopava]KIW07841.1 hypothetical protein PV09_01759 [Verruconis gallopava]
MRVPTARHLSILISVISLTAGSVAANDAVERQEQFAQPPSLGLNQQSNFAQISSPETFGRALAATQSVFERQLSVSITSTIALQISGQAAQPVPQRTITVTAAENGSQNAASTSTSSPPLSTVSASGQSSPSSPNARTTITVNVAGQPAASQQGLNSSSNASAVSQQAGGAKKTITINVAGQPGATSQTRSSSNQSLKPQATGPSTVTIKPAGMATGALTQGASGCTCTCACPSGSFPSPAAPAPQPVQAQPQLQGPSATTLSTMVASSSRTSSSSAPSPAAVAAQMTAAPAVSSQSSISSSSPTALALSSPTSATKTVGNNAAGEITLAGGSVLPLQSAVTVPLQGKWFHIGPVNEPMWT